MFINDTHLPQVLGPEYYTSQELHDREYQALFRDQWQLVGSLSSIPKDGDFFTFELFGKPLILWNRKGEVHAYLNVCPHRFSMLTHAPCGHAGDRLRCQYHGWEFDECGNTRKIPDARSFKPLKQGELGLVKFPVEIIGQLIFVHFSENPPSIREQLGPGYEVMEQLCGKDRRLVMHLDYEIACNWKIKIENTLESYHVECIHPKTFRISPPAEICFHEMEPHWTTYSTSQPAVRKIEHGLNKLMHRLAGRPFDQEYKHYYYYSSLMGAKMGLFSWAEAVYPVAPDRCRVLGVFFVYPGPPGTLKSKILYRLLSGWGRNFVPTVVKEDTSVMPDIQKGIESGLQPSRGLISVREERLFHFQEHVLKSTQACAGCATPELETASRGN